MDNVGNVRLYWEWDEQAIHATADKYGSYCSVIDGNMLDDHEDVEACVNDAYWQV